MASISIQDYDKALQHVSIADQINTAIEHPDSFNQEIRNVQQIFSDSPKSLSNSKYKMALCSHALKGKCTFGTYCAYSHLLVTHVAVNLLKNPNFKSVWCQYSDRCRNGGRCVWIHPGDLAQKLNNNGERHWYIAQPVVSAPKTEEKLPIIRKGVYGPDLKPLNSHSNNAPSPSVDSSQEDFHLVESSPVSVEEVGDDHDPVDVVGFLQL